MAGTPTESILDIIERRLIPNEEAKKARGEVFTPLPLVRELLFGVRKDNPTEVWGVNAEGGLFDDPAERIGGIPLEIWKNPESKWLDPANGIGNFPFVAFQMLDYQLKDVLKDTAARRKHIVEKMLCMIEIDKGNVNTAIKIFDQLAPGAAVQICCADTLTLKEADLVKEFGVSKFDVVMGNPPFQAPGGKRTGTTAAHGSIWDKFVTQSMTWLVPGGFLAFITPYAWRKPENPLWNILTRTHQLEYLRVLSKRTVMTSMKVSIGVDLYIVKNSPPDHNTAMVDEEMKVHSINASTWAFMPNYKLDDVQSILARGAEGINVMYNSFYDSRKVSPTKTGKFVYPVVHTITQSGLGIRYTDDNTKGHFGIPKVLLNKNERQYPVNDFEGKYGMSELTFGIPISSKEEGDLIVRAINTDRFKEIIKATKWSTFQTEYKMFKYFKPDFYKEFLPKDGASRRRTRRAKRRGTLRRAKTDS
jgi:hypothetical protein